ncbi:MAG: error-prone DNA polymerase [Blastocatellia bacterium]|nr:error-prone DNA polymerase [Blastocatellia bacterium]
MFYEMHTRSAFSFLASGSMPETIIERAAELGMPGVALLDRDTVSGAVRFHCDANDAGLKAMIGAEITMDDGSVLPLLPIDLAGYQNLCKMITTVKLRHAKGEHFATRKDIEEHSEGLICLTGGADGLIHRSIRAGNGQRDLAWLNYVFEKRLYVELQRHYLRSEEDVNQQLVGLAHKLHLPIFASNGAYYAHKDDRELFDVFTCIKNHCTIYEAGKILSQNAERHLKSAKQMMRLFEEFPEAVARTEEIAARIEFSMDDVGYTFPDFPVPPGETMDSLLRTLADKGARNRYGTITPQVRTKLDHELNLITKLKLAGYFLLVWDISDFCRSRRILSQGRGSAANSVVCYSLGITAVDPIAGELLFERFLSEERGEFPDIDIDLPSGDDRELVIQHVYEKYGRRGAAMTANVITYRGKSAVREVGKVFGFPEEQIGHLSKSISHHGVMEFGEMVERFKESGFDLKEDFRTRKFVELYTRILDFPRHLGQHSGGMVISLGRLDGVVPIEPASMEGRSIIQWDKDDCERLGIVKVDLLGLGMMAVLRDSLKLIKDHRDETVDLAKIPIDDKGVYETVQKGDTIGMFQIESRAQINFLPRSRPETFYDLVVQVAIIRPGPIVGKMLSAYIRRRQGQEEVDHIHPWLESTLKRTLGVPLFQEQLLRMSMIMAGFSGGQAEELRRAMGFKRADKRLAKIEQNLRDGMTRNDIDEETQDRIVHNITAFANYGFPESHAASFALLTYASAYLKVYYLAEFTTALLNNYPLGFYVPATLIKDAQRHGLRFRHVDVNRSDYLFKIEEAPGPGSEGVVRIGLKYVKGLREDTAQAIAAERGAYSTETGTESPYTSVEDLVRRVPLINKKEIRALSLAGALNFDNAVHRREALWQSELAARPNGELFRPETPPAADAFLQKMTEWQAMEADLQAMSITIGKHPMAFLRNDLKNNGVISAIETHGLPKREIVTVAGAVIVRQRPGTANSVVFITMEDETGHSNFIVMPDVFERFRRVITHHSYLLIKGISEEGNLIKALYFEPITAFMAEIGSHDFH